MSQRTVIVLAVALLALLALVLAGQRGGGESSVSGAVFLPGLDDALGALERVTVVRANGETVAALERRPDNWVATNKSDYVADAGKLRQALTALAEARILEEKTANPELYDRLGVEDVAAAGATGLRVELTAPGHELPSVILGNTEGARYRYVRRSDDDQSFLIDRNPDFPRTAAQWLDSRIIDVRSDRVREVTITHPDGEVVRISKSSPELTNFEVADVPEERELSYPGVANVTGNALRELNLEDVEPAPPTPPEDATVVEYRTFDGLVVRVTGTKTEDASWITLEASADATAAESPAADAAAPETPAAEASTAAATDGEAPAAEAAAGDAAAAAPQDPAAEAERINAKVRGWRYKIASYQYDQMTRRMADLLKAENA